MSKLEVDAIEPQSGTTLTLGASGDTINVAAGATNNLGITMADQWRLTADTNQGTDGDVTTNWERPDNTGYGRIGTGLTESSGIFSFSQTGVYLINHFASMAVEDGDLNAEMRLLITTDNSSYAEASAPTSGNRGSADVNMSQSAQFLFDVTNISTHKFKFDTSSFSTTTRLRGDTTVNETHFTVLRLGDT